MATLEYAEPIRYTLISVLFGKSGRKADGDKNAVYIGSEPACMAMTHPEFMFDRPNVPSGSFDVRSVPHEREFQHPALSSNVIRIVVEDEIVRDVDFEIFDYPGKLRMPPLKSHKITFKVLGRRKGSPAPLDKDDLLLVLCPMFSLH